MSDAARSAGQFGAGPLSRVAATVYTLLVVELLLLLSILPGLVPLALLRREASNLPLVALCLVPVGPALAAALHTLRHQRADLADLRPARLFRHGYRASLAAALRVWVPMLIWLTVIATNLAHLDAAGLRSGWAALLVPLAVAVTLCGINALVIVSFFTFRTRDVFRLALHLLARTPGVTLGNLLLLAAAVGVTAVLSEAVLALAGSVVVLALLRISDPLVDTVRREFTR